MKNFSCFIIHGVGFVLIYLNFPKTSNQFDQIESVGFILPNRILILSAALLLGLGDAGLNNIIYTSIFSIWKSDLQFAAGFAMMKCIQSAASAISFAFASSLDLYMDLLLLSILSVITILSYAYLGERTRIHV